MALAFKVGFFIAFVLLYFSLLTFHVAGWIYNNTLFWQSMASIFNCDDLEWFISVSVMISTVVFFIFERFLSFTFNIEKSRQVIILPQDLTAALLQ